MKAAEPTPSIAHQLSPSKRCGQHLAAGFEALDREFYSLGEEEIASGVRDDGHGNENSVTVDPQNALASLFESDSDSDGGQPEAKRPRRQIFSQSVQKIQDIRKKK